MQPTIEYGGIMAVDRSIVPPERVLSLAMTYDLSACDAAYLELSLRLKLPIAAKGGALRSAAEKAGVRLVKV